MADFEKMALKLDARYQIENIMSRYAFYLSSGSFGEIPALFSEAPDVRAEMNWGVYEGPAGIERLYSVYHAEVMTGPGVMVYHTTTTPVIEVAGDLETAKGVWISSGHMSGGPFTPDNSAKAFWAWFKWGCDFINEGGVWKIWHLHCFGTFVCPFEKPWTETGDVHKEPELPDRYRPDRPPTHHWAYSPEGFVENVPAPPVPYESFDPETAF